MNEQQRKLRARMGGLATRASGNLNTSAGRAAFDARFYRGIPEDLPVAERDARATAARKLHFARLALASSRARSKKRAA